MTQPVRLTIKGHAFDVSSVPLADYLAEHAQPDADTARSAVWYAWHRSGAAVRISRD
jgi:hypothetical protein